MDFAKGGYLVRVYEELLVKFQEVLRVFRIFGGLETMNLTCLRFLSIHIHYISVLSLVILTLFRR